MKKIQLTLYAILIFSLTQVFAQGVFVGVSGGLTSVKDPTYFTDDISSGGAGFSNGYHLGVLAKFRFPVSPITPVLSFNYHALRGNSGKTETSLNIYSIGLSTQFTITAGKVSPYISLDGNYNIFGKFKIDNPPSVTNGTFLSSAAALSSKKRFGGGFGIGADLNLINNIDIDLSLRYSIMNLIGAENSEGKLKFITINAAILF